jgi:hypothetical protein
MNSEQLLNGNLEPMLIDLLDDKLSDSDFSSLVNALRESEELRKRACLFLCDDTLLTDEIGTSQQVSILIDALSFQRQSNTEAAKVRPAASQKIIKFPLLQMVNRNGLKVAAAASLIVVALLVHNLMMMSKVSRLYTLALQGAGQGEVEVVVGSDQHDLRLDKRGDSDLALHEQPVLLGRIIGLSDAEVYEGATQYSLGDTLEEGQRIQIESGVLELLLSTGAKVTAEGPVDFELSSLLRMDLDRGKIVAAVPRTARGYTIVTPTSELVDIGTQFGVAVADSGDTELHVFDGDVVARSLVDELGTDLIHAKENEALRFDVTSAEPERLNAKESDFIRRLGPNISINDLPEMPKTNNLSLWLSADAISDANLGDSVSIWRDILLGDNKYANDARQFEPARCPTYAIDKANRPVLQFNGWSTVFTVDPIDYTDHYTIFLVCTPGPTSFAQDYFGGILFKHGDAPTLELSLLSSMKARGWVWPGRDKSNVGVLTSTDTMSDSQVSVIAYQYDSAASRARLWLNGKIQAETDAPIELRQTATAYIGGHSNTGIKANFFGGIYEIVIYNESLDDEKMQLLNSYFVERYDVQQLP